MTTELEAQGQLHSMLWGNTDINQPRPSDFAGVADAWLSKPIGVPSFSVAAPVEPSFFSRIAKPFTDFGTSLWEGGGEVLEGVSKKLPEVLWGWGKQKLGLTPRTVQEGAGRSTTYVGPAVSGGAPAQGPTIVVPSGGFIGRMPAATWPQAKIGVGLMIALGIGLVLLLKRK